MTDAAIFLAGHPFWFWMALAAVLLAVEMVTGTGYLLWPAASAAVVSVAVVFVNFGAPADMLIFAALTIGATLAGRRWLPTSISARSKNINERAAGLVGRKGEVKAAFAAGRGRVFVDGAEWPAELEADAEAPPLGSLVEVVEVVGGGLLKVRAG
jgi:hypothetical protein